MSFRVQFIHDEVSTATLKVDLNIPDLRTLHHVTSSSNWAFIALNLPFVKLDSKVQWHQDSQTHLSIQGQKKEVKHHREHRDMIKTKMGHALMYRKVFNLVHTVT